MRRVRTSVAAVAILILCGVIAQRGLGADDHLITSSSMGRVRLGMTLESARLALPHAPFERGGDGDGAALVHVAFGNDDSLVLSADEDDPNAPIDWSRHIVTIYTFSRTFHTAEGIRAGSLVTDVIEVLGPVEDIVVSEIESREFITFVRQPEWVTFQLDYAGRFPDRSRHTTQFAPGARILSVIISSRYQ